MNVAAKLGDGDPNAELLFEVLRVAVKVRTGRDVRWKSPLGLVVFHLLEDPSLARRAKVMNSL